MTPLLARRPCPVCASCEAQLWHTIDYPADAGRLLPSRYRIVCCTVCGMVYDDFDGGAEAFARYYREAGKYLMAETGGAGGVTATDEKRWRALAERLELELQNKNLSVIDLGCGKGGLLNYLWQQGFRDLTGVDASQGCIELIRQHYAFDAVCADVTNFQTERKFDLVLSLQVLEHLLDCRSYLRAVRELLSPGGTLCLEMPDAANYLSHDKAPFYFFDQEHVNHFAAGPLTNLLQACGFEVVETQSFEAEPVPGFVTPNLFVTAKKSPQTLPVGKSDPAAIWAYVEASRKRDRCREKIAGLAGTGFLWGVGAYCERLLEAGSFDGLQLAGLIDLDVKKQQKCVHGLTVFPPEILRKRQADFVIITSVLYEQAIRRQLQEAGFTGKVVVL